MMRHLVILPALALTLVTTLAAQTADQAPAKAVDITGQWTSTFETQIGTQSYTYDFVVANGKLTGTLKGSLSDGPSDVQDGKVEGGKVTFTETLTFQGMEIKVTYAGTITSPDEIAFTRNVGEFASEELVAKRVKK